MDSAEPTPQPDINVASGVSARTREAFISISWGEQAGQLSAEEARMFAMSILTAAEAAEQDAATAKVLARTDSEVVSLMALLRSARGSTGGSWRFQWPIGPRPDDGAHRA